MKYGYVRGQNETFTKAQIELLQDKVEKIVVEGDGEQLKNLLDSLQPNDSIYVYDLNRLTRKVDTSKEIVKTLLDKKVNLYTSNGEKINLETLGYSLGVISEAEDIIEAELLRLNFEREMEIANYIGKRFTKK